MLRLEQENGTMEGKNVSLAKIHECLLSLETFIRSHCQLFPWNYLNWNEKLKENNSEEFKKIHV